MFSQIVNPISNKKVNINSKVGKEILNNYINIQSGGKVEWSDRDGFLATGGPATRERSEAEIDVLQMLRVEYNGEEGNVQHYSEFWRNPNRRDPKFGYWNRNRFIPTSLNEFIIHNRNPSNNLINKFIDIIELRFLDSRQQAQRRRERHGGAETRVFHSHSDIIIGMLEAFWTLTETRKNTRLWLNDIDFLDIDQTVADHRNWHDISVGLTSSVMNYQLPEAELGQYGEEDELIRAFEGMRM